MSGYPIPRKYIPISGILGFPTRDFQINIPISGIKGFSGFGTRDFLGFFLEFSKSRSQFPEMRDFRDCSLGIFTWNFFGIFKFRYRSPEYRDLRNFSIQPTIKNPVPLGIRVLEKISTRSQLWFSITFKISLFFQVFSEGSHWPAKFVMNFPSFEIIWTLTLV